MCETSDLRLRGRVTEPRPRVYLDFWTFLDSFGLFFSCAFQVLLSWIICWLLVTRHRVQTQHPDGPRRLPQEQSRGERERERGSNDRLEDTSVWMYWKTLELRERICTGLVCPRTFFPSAHIYTHLFFREKKKKKTLLEWQLPFLDTNELLLEHRVGESKRNSVKPTDSNQPCWALGGNVDTKKSSESKNFWPQKKRKRKANGGIAVGDLSDRWFEIGGGAIWPLKTNL